MTWLVAILRELLAIFVDDLAYAIGILAIIAVMGFAAHAFARPSPLIGIELLAGLVAALITGTMLKARSIAHARARAGRDQK